MGKSAAAKTIAATGLVGGTCVGGGILALPVETGWIGLWPAILVLLASWLFMTLTALLYAEASLWMHEDDAHVVTMSKHLLGRFGEYIAIILYLFMGYASLVAYNSGGSILIVNFVNVISDYGLARWEACIIFAVIFGSVLYLGSKILGWINSAFVIGLIVAYFSMVTIGIGEIQTTLYNRFAWKGMYSILPLMITSFSFQMIVPSLALYLDHDAKALKRSIMWGTCIPAAAYLLWLVVVLGVVPNEGAHGLAHALKQGVAATESLKYFTQSRWLASFAEYFAFFAIVTSYLGIALGLYDFLSDLTKIQKKGWGKFILGLLVFVPTLYFTVIFPNAFLTALDITGGLGDSLLNGVIPVLMVWIGRYCIGYESELKLGGGRFVLFLLFTFSLVILTSQIVKFFA